jgi:hypothetical protein
VITQADGSTDFQRVDSGRRDRPLKRVIHITVTHVDVMRSETIRCRPQRWLDLVLDVHQYAAVDDKIGPIKWVRRDGDLTEFRFTPRLPGVPLPQPAIVSQMRLVPGKRIDVVLAPLPRNLSTRVVVRFRAWFSCEAIPEGVRVTRMISFKFAPPLRWLAEPVLRRTLPVSVERELRLAKQLLESGGAT